MVHATHQAREHGSIPHAGVKQAQRRRRRMNMRELQSSAPCYGGFLVAGIDERQIFLTIVIEAKRRVARLRFILNSWRGGCHDLERLSSGPALVMLWPIIDVLFPGIDPLKA